MSRLLNASFAQVCRALMVLTVFALLAGCASREERAQGYYDRGTKLLEQKDYVKAALEFRNAVKLKNDMIGAWRGLAQIEERNKNWSALAGILRTIVQLDPKDVDSRLRLGKLMLMANALDDALKLIDAAGESADQNPAVLAFKGALFLKLNDRVGAVREAQAALAIDPNNTEAAIVLAAERLARGDSEGALLILNHKEFADVKNISVQIFKLLVLERMGDLPQVEGLLKKLVEAFPEEPAFRRQLIRFYVMQKRPEDAEREMRALADSRPDDIAAALDVARFLAAVKGSAAAREELIARIKAGGQVFQFQMALAGVYFAEGNFVEAKRLLEELAKTSSSRTDSLAAEVKLAEMYQQRKETPAAETLIANILRKDDHNTAALKLRAAIRIDRGELDAAVADLRQALNDQPRSVELMMLLAIAYERGGSIELAEKEFADATKVSGFDPTAGLAYVAFLRRRGNIARAEDVAAELAGRQPRDRRVLAALADVRLARGNWTGAQEVAEVIRRMGDEGDNRVLADQILAASLSGRSRFDESIGVLKDAYDATQSAVQPAIQPMVALVRSYVLANQPDRAVGFLETVLKKNPDNAEALVMLGSLDVLKNAPDQAIAKFKSAIEKQPKSIVAYRALADLYIRQGKNDDALTVIRAGLEVQPDSALLRLILASILELKEDYEGAISEYEKMLKDQPGSLVAANNLASLLSDHRTDKASLDRAYALAAILRKSPTPQFKDTLGWLYYQRGEYKTAIPLLEEAATQLPNNAVVHYHFGMTYIATGENAKAAEQLKKALELASKNKELGEKIAAALKKTGA